MATEELCPTNLLDDSPAEDDEFGSHERVAEAIVQLLETEDEGGKSIGLEGGWGSGKSTVVRLIEKKLSQTKTGDFKVAVFDMWAHQGDPLRRTFLQSLIGQLRHWKWVNQKTWMQRQEELAQRRSEEITREIPRLTIVGVIFAFLLLSIPIGSALIAASATLLAAQNTPANDTHIWNIGYFQLGMLLMLVPAIFYVIAIVAENFLGTSMSDGKQRKRWWGEFPALVTGKASTETQTIATQSPDPTSVEFESEFRDLLDEALKPRKKRKLLLVIDNLDRVQPSDALAIWSTLQTFLGHTHHKKHKWIDSLWVLIPYDRDAILRLWDSSDSVESKSPNKTLTETFLDKTFQIRFRVPSLLLTNWREFLHKALKDALPDHQEEDFHDIYRTYGINGGLDKSPPKPRDLKIFANQIGALHRERQHDFELSHYACYVLLMKEVENLHNDLISKTDHNLPMRIIGGHWRDVIAAIHFGVDVDEARQLLLRGPIETALTESDGQTLGDLRTAHPEGFWAVLDDCVPTGAANWNSLNSDELAKGASALVDSQVFDYAENRPEAAALQSIIRRTALAVRLWHPFDDAKARGMIAIFQLVEAPGELVPTLTKAASNAYYSETDPEEWMTGALALVDGLVELGFEKQIQQGISIPLSADEWLNVSSAIASDDHERRLLQYLDIQAIQAVDRQLAERLNRAQFDDYAISVLSAALATRSRNAMSETAVAASSQIRSGRLQSNQIANAMKILRISQDAGLFTGGEYADLATSGRFLRDLYLGYRNRNSEVVAECMFGHLRIVTNVQESRVSGDSYQGLQVLTELFRNPDFLPGTVEHFTSLVKETQQLQIVLDAASAERPVPNFLSTVLSSILNSEDVTVPIEMIGRHWSVIRETFLTQGDPQRFELFLKRTPGLNDLVTETAKGEFNVAQIGLYIALLKSDGNADFANWCASGLASIDQQTWSEGIASKGEFIELVNELDKRNTEMTFGVAFYDALVAYAKKIAQDIDDTLPQEKWNLLVNMLDSRHHALLPRRVYEILEEENGGVTSLFYDFFGGMLIDGNLLADEPRFIDRVCRPIVDTGNTAGITWLANLAKTNPRLLARHSDQAAVEDLSDRIRQRIEAASDDDPISDLRKIGSALDASSGSWWSRK